MSQSNRPEFQLQIGHVQGSVWLNYGKNGSKYYSTTICKAYQDESGWKQVNNYNTGDLASLVAVSKFCLDWIIYNPLDRGRQAPEPQPQQQPQAAPEAAEYQQRTF